MLERENTLYSPEPVAYDEGQPEGARLEETVVDATVALAFKLQWQSGYARHTDCRYQSKLNLWRDIFPVGLEEKLVDRPLGYTHTEHFQPGDVTPAYRPDDLITIPDAAFNRRLRRQTLVEPRVGRFYPRGFIAGVRDIYAQDVSPMRVCSVSDQLDIDLNHPLAGTALDLTVAIRDIRAASRPGGRCQDIADLVAGDGPGMQVRWRDRETDYWSDEPFLRLSPGPDAAFYQTARLVHHTDRTAMTQIEQLYERLLPERARVLDLMASWRSHLPDSLSPADVTGLGLNREELDANPHLGERVEHDINVDTQLPFDDASFDAVVCTVSVEYLIHPVETFAEVCRVLRPGGRFILTFSNRWFPPKVVRVWEDIHEFERPGLVLEYFIKAGGYGELETWSMRGLPRPIDDKYADRLLTSDPVHAVWGVKN